MNVEFEDVDRVLRTEIEDLNAVIGNSEVADAVVASVQIDVVEKLRADIAAVFYNDLDEPEPKA